MHHPAHRVRAVTGSHAVHEFWTLTEAEAGLLVDALKGYPARAELAPSQGVLNEVQDAIHKAATATRWGVRDEMLIAGCAMLTDEQAEFVLAAAEAFWSLEDARMSLREQLIEAGLL